MVGPDDEHLSPAEKRRQDRRDEIARTTRWWSWGIRRLELDLRPFAVMIAIALVAVLVHRCTG